MSAPSFLYVIRDLSLVAIVPEAPLTLVLLAVRVAAAANAIDAHILMLETSGRGALTAVVERRKAALLVQAVSDVGDRTTTGSVLNHDVAVLSLVLGPPTGSALTAHMLTALARARVNVMAIAQCCAGRMTCCVRGSDVTAAVAELAQGAILTIDDVAPECV